MATAKTETIKILVVDAVTGVEIERALTAEELTQRELDQSEAIARQADKEAMATARASALAKLAELGLTEDEIAAL
jgi:hypothetical protein